jgi:hypothetical protein
MNNHKSCQKKEHLLKKMYQGAEALRDFFETMKEVREANPADVAEQLKTQYHLTPNQRTYLDGVADRTSKARAVVQYLEHRFGLNEDQTFQDPQGLHKLLFNDPKKRVKATSYNFAIGFTNSYWTKERSLGYANAVIEETPCVLTPSKKIISSLERGLQTDCANLAFHLPSDTRTARTAARINNERTQEGKLHQAIFGDKHSTNPEELKEQVRTHELRHIIDYIIKANGHLDFFTETQAYLYAGIEPLQGLSKDFEREDDKFLGIIEIRERRLKRFEEDKAPQFLIDKEKELIEEARERYERHIIESDERWVEQLGIFKEFKEARISQGIFNWERDRQAKSYLFSTMPPEKLFRRIQQITFAQPEEIELNDEERKLMEIRELLQKGTDLLPTYN